MNALDVVLVLAGVAAVAAGWRMGFVRRVASWAGLLGGLGAALWALPRLLPTEVDPASPSRFVAVTGMLLLGASLGHLLGTAVGNRLGIRSPPGARSADATFGALAGAAGALLTAWILLPAMADVPGWPAEAARTSVLARAIDDALGSPPGLLDDLADSLGLEGLPRVFEDLGPAPEVAEPPPGSPVDAATVERAAASTLKVSAEACGRLQLGTGAVVAPGLVVTNAHVVAGAAPGALAVETLEGRRLGAETLAFDPAVDLALLRVAGLDRAPLPLADGGVGDLGVVLGYAGGGPLTVNPYVVGREVTAVGRDIYDREQVERGVFVLGADLAPGDSGGPLVDPAGSMIGVAFAIAPDEPDVAYAVTDEEVRRLVESAAGGGVSLGPCLR